MARNEFPRCVYGPDDEWKTIQSEAERPDGWSNEPGGFVAPETIEAEIAKAEAKAADKALRDEVKAYLDSFGVEYANNLGTDKLLVLKDQLDAHLAASAAAPSEPELNDNPE